MPEQRCRWGDRSCGMPNKRVQADAAAAARISARNWLCNALRIEAHFGENAARLTRRALGTCKHQVSHGEKIWLVTG